MITTSGTIDAADTVDAIGLDLGAPGMPEEWSDGADPLVLTLAAVLATPGVTGTLAMAIGAQVRATLAAYARGDVEINYGLY